MVSIDEDSTVCESIAYIYNSLDYFLRKIFIFMNGGDRGQGTFQRSKGLRRTGYKNEVYNVGGEKPSHQANSYKRL